MDWCRGSHRVGQLVLTLRRRDKWQAVGGSEAGGGGRSAPLELPWEAMSWAGSDSASPLLHSISALSLESDHRPKHSCLSDVGFLVETGDSEHHRRSFSRYSFLPWSTISLSVVSAAHSQLWLEIVWWKIPDITISWVLNFYVSN